MDPARGSPALVRQVGKCREIKVPDFLNVSVASEGVEKARDLPASSRNQAEGLPNSTF